MFDPTAQFQVATIVLNNNQLTGTLPAAVFHLKPQTFVGTSNCFEGPLPTSAICDNLNMVSFVIDGMSAASSCRNKLFVGSLSAYALDHDIGGSLPICMFQLPNITTLHLSGNGFTGRMPSNIFLSDTLTDLSLSHNVLTGSIPSQIQLRQWDNLDLSYNRLSGTLMSNFESNGTIALEDNRISGVIPPPFRTMKNINVLDSNTFSCSYDEANLPQHDPNRERYHCGSNSFDLLYYIWMGAAAIAVAVMLYIGYKYDYFRSRDTMLQSTNLYKALSSICQLAFTCTLYALAVLLPLYAACSAYYGTQTHKYAYQISAVYVSGTVPFALYWCFWLLFVAVVAAFLFRRSASSSDSRSRRWSPYNDCASWPAFLYPFVPYLLIDCIVVAGVNAAYVYVAVYKSSSLLLVVQTLLSIFKVVWGRCMGRRHGNELAKLRLFNGTTSQLRKFTTLQL